MVFSVSPSRGLQEGFHLPAFELPALIGAYLRVTHPGAIEKLSLNASVQSVQALQE